MNNFWEEFTVEISPEKTRKKTYNNRNPCKINNTARTCKMDGWKMIRLPFWDSVIQPIVRCLKPISCRQKYPKSGWVDFHPTSKTPKFICSELFLFKTCRPADCLGVVDLQLYLFAIGPLGTWLRRHAMSHLWMKVLFFCCTHGTSKKRPCPLGGGFNFSTFYPSWKRENFHHTWGDDPS